MSTKIDSKRKGEELGKRGSTSREKKIKPYSKELAATVRAAKIASSNAIRVSEALDLPIQFIKNGKLVEVRAGHKEEILKEIPKVESKIKLSEGMKICLK